MVKGLWYKNGWCIGSFTTILYEISECMINKCINTADILVQTAHILLRSPTFNMLQAPTWPYQEHMSTVKRHKGASNYCTLFVTSPVQSRALNFG